MSNGLGGGTRRAKSFQKGFRDTSATSAGKCMPMSQGPDEVVVSSNSLVLGRE